MIINLSPVRMDDRLRVERAGDTLVLNGESFDLSPLLEGASLPASAISSPWFTGSVDRVGGELSLTLILPHGADAPQSTRFPEPIVTTNDGIVALPPYELAVDEPEEATDE
ncbi:hypothetical protein JIQ88_01560 [Pseudomonas sp. PCH44]|uniref:hypothetical protein n=1 Tax=Pseudomonas sp. PCH44 TaxID=2800904 RepID=UPI001BAFBA82|nr:hypothetical protein [Pseudomonas sp. PCH44]MBS3183767.1 hypothetical protein [Pseudomonas sp. PCH44]